jgi:hypothetical protein
MTSLEWLMTDLHRGLARTGAIFLGLVLLAGCTSSRLGSTRAVAPPEQITPVQTSSVQTSNLPPISGTDANGNPMVLGPDGTVVNAGTSVTDPTFGSDPFLNNDPLLAGTEIIDDGSFVSLDDLGSTPGSTSARDLSGGLTVPKLLGVWTVISGASQCRLNLTQTAKSGTSRYRASTPGCQVPVIASVASWQLAGNQVQLFNEEGDIVGALLLSGSRFIGTLAGGQGVSMVG